MPAALRGAVGRADLGLSRRSSVPFRALHAFEAVARNRGIRAAAEELCVTRSAVTHQLRALEAYLGHPVVEHAAGRLKITEAGARLLPDVARALDRIDDAIGRAAGGRERPRLRLSIPPEIADYWLIPRLFGRDRQDDRPSFDLDLTTGQDATAGGLGRHDAAVRRGAGPWNSARSDWIMQEAIDLVAPPDHPVAAPGCGVAPTFATATLFIARAHEPAFERWCRHASIDLPEAAALVRVDRVDSAIRAAAAGHGLAMVSLPVAASEIGARRLQPVLNAPLFLDEGYYLLTPDDERRSPAIEDLRERLLCTPDAPWPPWHDDLTTTEPARAARSRHAKAAPMPVAGN